MFKHRTLTDFIKDESAVGTVMALFWFIVCAGIVGLSVDTSNAWRQKERLQLTADVASHAGLLVILAGGSADDARLAARNSVLSNMPNAGFGRVINEDIKDIILSDFDRANVTVSDPATVEDIDAVTVQLHRDDAVENPVGTYLLQFVGFTSWEVKRSGTTVVVDYEKCPKNEGVWAHGKISSNDDNYFGAEFCVHSQDEVQLPQDTIWESGSFMGMPSLKKCIDDGKCDDTANPGIEDAMNEINLQLPSFDELIMDTYNDMLEQTYEDGELVLNERQQAFWDRTPEVAKETPWKPDPTEWSEQLTPVWDDLFGTTVPGPGEPGYVEPAVGTVVPMTADQFRAMDRPPAGLTYDVTCNPNGSGVNTILQMLPTSSGLPVRDIALLTNCSISFENNSDWRGVMVISTRVQANPTLSASAEASVADPNGTCGLADWSYVFARSNMQVAAEFAASNTVFMSGGDVQIASGTSGEVTHNGMTVFADGSVNLTTDHNFNACGYALNDIILGLPDFTYIKQVVPTNEQQRIAEVN